MTQPRGVLITNDDGIAAPGLRWLARAAVQAGMPVVIAAPLAEASGMSAAMTAVTERGRVVVERRDLADLGGTPAYGVSASPGYIVELAALGAFGDPPELILSGINRGANAGHAVAHSGTVGAALTAAGKGRRAMAVSLDVLSPASSNPSTGGAAIATIDTVNDETRHWSTAAELARQLFPALADAPPGIVLNLNVPDLPNDRVRGVRRAALAPFGQVQMAIAESGEDYVRTTIEESGARHEPGTDLAYLAEGYASLTPIRPLREAADVALTL